MVHLPVMSTYTGLWRGVVSGMFEAVISPLVAVRMQKARAACEEAATEVFESGKTRCGFRYWVASRSTTPYGTALTRYVVDERLSLFYTANAIYPDDGGSVLTIFGGRTFREHLFEHAKAQYYGHPLPGFGTAFVNKNQDTGPYEAVFKAVEWWSNPLLAAFYDTERASWMGVLTPGKRSPRKPSDGAGCSLMMVVKAAEGREAVVTGTMGRGNYQMYVSEEEGIFEVSDLASPSAVNQGTVPIEKGLGCFHLKDPCFGIVKEGEMPRMSCMPHLGVLPRMVGRNWIVLISVFDPMGDQTAEEDIRGLVRSAFSGAREVESVLRRIMIGLPTSATVMIVHTGEAGARPLRTKEMFLT
ncbi:hypothetical protein FOZ62_025298 [Perkinsus olseni]|uniref:Uncharacterized protein n=1 Tax=Perkinsus olseni TaxID=32597 RepID=A0A7J6R2R7_PEROL|nr:hypothetical protein FOZ62_025298 [Perkinsus olseni]